MERIPSSRQSARPISSWSTTGGPTNDEERYCLFIGVELGALGWEADEQSTIPERDLLRIMESVKQALAQAGLPPTPALHMQLEPK